MAKDHKSKGEPKEDKAINQHKRMAMGENITGMKKGGKAEYKAKEGGHIKKRGK